MKKLHRGGYEETSHNNKDSSHTKEEHKKEKGCLDFSFLDQEPEDYRKAFIQFVEYRKESKKPMSQTSMQMLHKRLSVYQVQERITSIENSITSGWQGVFPKEKTARELSSDKPSQRTLGNDARWAQYWAEEDAKNAGQK